MKVNRMKTEKIFLTAEKAADLLKANTQNRTVRKSHVEGLRMAFERGEYVMTHQGIAFDEEGTLLDGQHRLLAISQVPDLVFPILMTTGLPRKESFGVIDTAAANRNVADVLGMNRKRVEVGTFLARTYSGKTGGLTPTFCRPFVELTAPHVDELQTFCSSTCRTWSSAPVRAAAVINLLRGVSTDYVKLIYRSMVLADFESMPAVARSLFRSHLTGKVRAGNGLDIFARSLKAFDPKNENNSKIVISSLADVSAETREFLRKRLSEQERAKKKAPVGAGAKKVSSHAHSTAQRDSLAFGLD